MKDNLLIKLMFFIFFLQSCSVENNVTKEPFSSITKSSEIVKANNKFAFDIFKEVIANEAKDNIMISPVSLSLALGMTYNGAESETKTAFENTLNYNTINREDINNVNKAIIDNITDNSSGSLFEVANSIWIKNTFPVKEDFINLNKQNYYAEIQNLDFNNTNSVNIINNWGANKTHQKISKIINGINSDAVMFLINALYFKSDWKYSFKEEDTTEQPFYINASNSISVKMMQLKSDLDYYANDTFSSVILPYKNDKYNMTLLLPNTNKNINDVINLMDASSWQEWHKQYKKRGLNLLLPKFKFSYSKQLKKPLSNLGLGNAFSSSADFSSISDIATYISFVLQKTYIDVNEKGTEAAAVTVVGIVTTSAGSNTLTFNNPFLFIITEKETNSICFIGKVGVPDYQ